VHPSGIIDSSNLSVKPGQPHAERVLREFVSHYNRERPHRGIDLEPLVPNVALRRFKGGDVVERVDRLGGLLHEYQFAA